MKPSTWTKPAILYVIDLNGMTKFGITTNWKARMRLYRKDFPDLPLTEVKKVPYDKRWQAELVEQMMSRRLKLWLAKGRYEWVIDLPLQQVMDCLYQINQVINRPGELERSSTIYYTGTRRFGYYDQLYDILKDDFDKVKLHCSKNGYH